MGVAKFKLGVLCPQKHRYNRSQFSLRYNYYKGPCIKCVSIRGKLKYKRVQSDPEKREKWLEQHRTHQRNYFDRHRERAIRSMRRYRRSDKYKTWVERYRPVSNATSLEHWRRNKDKARKRQSKYNQTPTGRLVKVVCSQKRRALKKSRVIPYTTAQVQARFMRFGYACVYCGSSKRVYVDHLIALSKGGLDCISNFVPACPSCNSSKYNKDPLGWLERIGKRGTSVWRRVVVLVSAYKRQEKKYGATK